MYLRDIYIKTREKNIQLRRNAVINNYSLNSKDLKSLCQDGVIKKQ